MMLESRSSISHRAVRTVRARAYSLIEAIIATAVLCGLLFVVGDAVTHTLRAASLSGGRAGSARTVSELAIRMSEEARSSTAVFIPASDVLGNPNSGTSAHEVDFFRRLSAGGDTYVAYRFDAAGGSVTRYEYAPASAGAAIVHADLAAENIAAFSPLRATAGSMADVLDPATVNDVSILYGSPGVVGGNDVVTVTVQGAPSGGISPAPVEVHLASRAAPTSLSVLTPANPPPPPPNGPITIPFVVRGNKLLIPHGPWHFGDPGNTGGAEFSGIHRGSIPGFVQYYGTGGGVDWFSLIALYPSVESGTYSFVDQGGNHVTITISCGIAPCPRFKPLPSSGSPPAPTGGVAFDALP